MVIKMEHNVQNICRSGLCTGCGTCKSICPTSAINIKISRGNYAIHVDQDLCNKCGLCLKVCPGHQVNFKEIVEFNGLGPNITETIGSYSKCYIGHSTDEEIRYNSSSGGLVTQLLLYALDEGIITGALVTRMSDDNPFEAEVFLARTRDQVIEASGSKYCPVAVNTALEIIMQSRSNEKFAVVGLPCHLHGIRKYEMINPKLREKIVLHLGLFCSSGKTFLATDYQLHKMGIGKVDVKKIAYRGSGWPGSFSVETKSGKLFTESHHEYYNDIFSSFTPWRCTLCVDETAELADSSFGDAWLPNLEKDDRLGTSLIITRNTLTEKLLESMHEKGILHLSRIDISSVSQSQGNATRKRLFNSRCTISKYMFLKHCPKYSYELTNKSLINYIISLNVYLKIILTQRRTTWGLLAIYCNFIRAIRKVNGEIKKLIIH